MEAYSGKIIDAHVHVFGKGTQGVRDMLAFEKEQGYEACNYLSCECMGDAAQNALGIYLKLCAPENFAFGGQTYRCDCDFAAELRLARGDVVGFHCWEIRRMHINRFMLRPSEPKKPQELSNKTCKLTKTT